MEYAPLAVLGEGFGLLFAAGDGGLSRVVCHVDVCVGEVEEFHGVCSLAVLGEGFGLLSAAEDGGLSRVTAARQGLAAPALRDSNWDAIGAFRGSRRSHRGCHRSCIVPDRASRCFLPR